MHMLCGYMLFGFTCFPFSFYLFISLRPPSGQTSGDYSFIAKMADDVLLLDLPNNYYFFKCNFDCSCILLVNVSECPPMFDNILLKLYKAVFVSADTCMIYTKLSINL